LQLRDISKSFGGTTALDRVTFGVRRAEIHALCGGNGSGKSTLIKILAGVHKGDTGLITVNDSVCDATKTTPTWAESAGLHFVHQAVGVFPDRTVAENFALASTYGARSLERIAWRRLHRQVKEILERFDVDVSTHATMGDLAVATQMMVAVARSLRNEAEPGRGILILDEPTAALPSHEAETVLEAMTKYAQRGHAVIFVTHRLREVFETATTATFLRNGRHIETSPLSALTERDFIERITGGSSVQLDRTRGRVVTDKPRLVVKGLAVGPLSDASLSVMPGEVVGLSGLLGSGRSALMQGLFGARALRAGSVHVDGAKFAPTAPRMAIARRVVYLPEDRAGQAAFPELSVRENLTAATLDRYWRRIRISRGAEIKDVNAEIRRFGVVVSSSEALFSSMSGGNQQKVILARWLAANPVLLMLDEPTQGVDVGARRAIHAQVREFASRGGSVIVASSDPGELAEICDRVVGIWQGRIVGEARGSDLTTGRCAELAYGGQTT
jgi:ribose transport system ATP-binding protein